MADTLFRHSTAGSHFGSNLTAATYDTTLSSILTVFVILMLAFVLIIPTFRLNKNSIFMLSSIFFSLTIGLIILLGNYGYGWEARIITTRTPYHAFNGQHIRAKVGLHIGVQGINVSLKGVPEHQFGQRIDYDEHFSWGFMFQQGRLGFGPFAGQIARDFRQAQFTGVPIPILNVAEWFVLDGEHVLWGRYYRIAGLYTWIFLWMAFSTWCVANLLFLANLKACGYATLLTGGLMLGANIVWASITSRAQPTLAIPFQDDVIRPAYAWTFYLVLVGGLVTTLIAVAILAVVRVEARLKAAKQQQRMTVIQQEEITVDPDEIAFRRMSTVPLEVSQHFNYGVCTRHSPVFSSRGLVRIIELTSVLLSYFLVVGISESGDLSDLMPSRGDRLAIYITFCTWLAFVYYVLVLVYYVLSDQAKICGRDAFTPERRRQITGFEILWDTIFSMMLYTMGSIIIGECKHDALENPGICARGGDDERAMRASAAFAYLASILALYSMYQSWNSWAEGAYHKGTRIASVPKKAF